MNDKTILDVTCGSRSIWFDKHEPHTVYCDRRECMEELPYRQSRPNTQHLVVDPDIVCDFTDLPFDDCAFDLVVFDPPHAIGLTDSWISKKYGTYETKEEMLKSVADGFAECWRVLKNGGVLIFKWGRGQCYRKRDHRSNRSHTAFRSQEREEKRNALDVLYEVLIGA